MEGILLQDDIKLVESKINKFETNTGCELLLILAKSSDQYPAANWRFGILSGFFITFIFSFYFDFHHGHFWPAFMFVVTLFMTWMGHFTWAKRLALSDWEVDRECLEKSIECFHTMGTSKVTHKSTAMIMVSVLERKITVLVDEKLKTQITQAELDELVQIMRVHFKQGNMTQGFVQSIESLEQKILKDFGGKVSDVNPSELKNQIVFL